MNNYLKLVLPRDAFNQAKLLKGIGMLTLYMHDCKFGLDELMTYEHDPVIEDQFVVCLDDSEGGFYLDNVRFFDTNNEDIYFFHPCNCQLNHTLCFRYKGESENVFNEDGSINSVFLKLLKE